MKKALIFLLFVTISLQGISQKSDFDFEINTFLKYPSSHYLVTYLHSEPYRNLDYSIRYSKVHSPYGLSAYYQLMSKGVSKVDIGTSITKLNYTSHSMLTWFGSLTDTIGAGEYSAYISTLNVRYRADFFQVGVWLYFGVSFDFGLNIPVVWDEEFTPSPYYAYQKTPEIKWAFPDCRIGAYIGFNLQNGGSILIHPQFSISPTYHKSIIESNVRFYNLFASIGYRNFF